MFLGFFSGACAAEKGKITIATKYFLEDTTLNVSGISIRSLLCLKINKAQNGNKGVIL